MENNKKSEEKSSRVAAVVFWTVLVGLGVGAFVDILWPTFGVLVGVLYAFAMVPVYQYVCNRDAPSELVKVLFSTKLKGDRYRVFSLSTGVTPGI